MRKRASDVFVEDTFDGIPVKIKVDDGYYDEAWQILDNCGPCAYIDDDWYDYDYEEFNELCCSDGEIEPYSDVLGIYHAETGELLYGGSRPCYSYNQDHSDAIDVAYEMWRDNEVYKKFSMRRRAYMSRKSLRFYAEHDSRKARELRDKGYVYISDIEGSSYNRIVDKMRDNGFYGDFKRVRIKNYYGHVMYGLYYKGSNDEESYMANDFYRQNLRPSNGVYWDLLPPSEWYD